MPHVRIQTQIIAVVVTLALAIPFVILALIELVYLTDYAGSIGGAVIGMIEWRSVALEGSARWPEVAGMIMGQLLILSMLLIARRHRPADGPDLFDRDATPSVSEHARSEQADPLRHA